MRTNIANTEVVSSNFENSEKIHHAKPTSKESFRIVNDTGQRTREKVLIYEAIAKHQPVTSRRLVELTGKERTNITRSLYDLIHEINPSIKEAFTDVCPQTGRRVTYYSLIWWTRKPLASEQLKLIP